MPRFACRVGGGIRDVETAVRWLDLGARKVILGTAAKPEILSRLPRERVIAALDARHGEVVVEGWQEGTGRGILERIAELKPHVGGFLVTFVELEGRMGGTDLELAKAVVAAAGEDCRVTIAGGVTTAEEIAALDEIGADAQVGMALYTGRLDLADAIMAPLVTDRPDGLYPDRGGRRARRVPGPGLLVPGESIREAVRRRMGIYQSRSRGLWVKGETSGATQELLRIDLDCDRDSPRFVVRQHGPGFCHLDTRTCWGEDAGLGRLARTLAERRAAGAAGQLHGQAVRRSRLARRQAARGGGRAGPGGDPRRGDLGGGGRPLLHPGPARARRHRPGRGRGASRPAGAQGHAARMRVWEHWRGRIAPVLERRVLVSLLLIAGGLWLFLGLADEIREGEQFRLDRAILLLFREPGDPAEPIGPVGWNPRCATSLRWAGTTIITMVTLVTAGYLMLSGKRHMALSGAGRRSWARCCSASRSRPASSGRGPSCFRMARRSTRRASRAAMPRGRPPPI